MSILDIEKCYCGRELCDFVDHSTYDGSTSYTRKEVEEMYANVDAEKLHLEKLLNPSSQK